MEEEECDPNDVNDFYNFIIRAIRTAEIESTTSKTVTKRKKEMLCPWINDDIKKLCNYKANLLKKRKKRISRNLNCDELNCKLMSISNVIIFKKRISKTNYYKNLFEKSNSRNTWQNINQILGSKNLIKDGIKSISLDDVEITEKVEIAESFNKYYTEIASEMSEDIMSDDESKANYFNSLTSEVNSIFLSPTDENEVLVEIMNLKDDKLPGCDKLSAKCS